MNLEAQPSGAPVRVELGARAYDIHIGEGLVDRAGALIAPLLARPKTAIVTDEVVAGLHLDRLRGALAAAGIEADAVVVPGGEASKSVAEFGRVCEALLAAGIERRDTIVAFGGGVVGDLAGFAAAALHRGIDFVQIPTTLLAQVDSSVGGKTGINLPHGKNLVGAFHQPVLVLADTAILGTLPEREMKAGYAEVAKYAFLGDRGFFDWLEDSRDAVLSRDGPARAHAVRVSCLAKARIVADDERESGARGLLNLGHTFGHAFEAAVGYTGELLHGEAVAIGTSLAFDLSVRLGHCPAEDAAAVHRHLAGAGLPTGISTLSNRLPDAEGIVALMGRDKKVVSGTKTLVLARGIGEAFLSREVDDSVLKDFIAHGLTP
jgi:3-dehydroquinate synthase